MQPINLVLICVILLLRIRDINVLTTALLFFIGVEEVGRRGILICASKASISWKFIDHFIRDLEEMPLQ